MVRIINFDEAAGELERIVRCDSEVSGICIPLRRDVESKPTETVKPRRRRRKRIVIERIVKLDDHRDSWTANLQYDSEGEVVHLIDKIRSIYEEIEGHGMDNRYCPSLYGIVKTEQLDLIRESEYARIVLRLLQGVRNPSGLPLSDAERYVRKKMGEKYNKEDFHKAISDMKETDLICPFNAAPSIMLHVKFEEDYTGGDELRRLLHMCGS